MQHPGDHFLTALLAARPQDSDCPYAAAVAPGEDPAWLDALHARLTAEQEPADSIEAHLVWRMTLAIWRAERAIRAEAAAGGGDRPGEALRTARLEQDRALLELERAATFLIERRRLLHAEASAEPAAAAALPGAAFLDSEQIGSVIARAGGPANHAFPIHAGPRETSGRPWHPPERS